MEPYRRLHSAQFDYWLDLNTQSFFGQGQWEFALAHSYHQGNELHANEIADSIKKIYLEVYAQQGKTLKS
jgi:hypothetical protein